MLCEAFKIITVLKAKMHIQGSVTHRNTPDLCQV